MFDEHGLQIFRVACVESGMDPLAGKVADTPLFQACTPIRAHLTHIAAKTGTHSRMELTLHVPGVLHQAVADGRCRRKRRHTIRIADQARAVARLPSPKGRPKPAAIEAIEKESSLHTKFLDC